MAGIKTIPSWLVEHFLLGRAGPGELQRFTQDAGIVADVWLNFAKDLTQPQRVLFTPVDGMPAVEAAALVHDGLQRYREASPDPDDKLRKLILKNRVWNNVSPLESFVAATVYFDELIRVILPLSNWWSNKNLDLLSEFRGASTELRTNLEIYIHDRLGQQGTFLRKVKYESTDASSSPGAAKILEATTIVALVGLFAAVANDARIIPREPASARSDEELFEWAKKHAGRIARDALRELRHSTHSEHLAQRDEILANPHAISANPHATGKGFIQRVFLDRETLLADTEAISTVKADAADRVFDISCKSLTWAIIDSGVAASHPAFDEFEIGEDGKQFRIRGRSRVRATFDLTKIDQIRNFDLTVKDPMNRATIVDNIIAELEALPGERPPDFKALARENLNLIAAQLQRRLLPDWALIEPLIKVAEDDGAGLSSDHGTHVAGILAADWREQRGFGDTAEKVVLKGICPDISLYDLRVLHPSNIKSTEFAIIAALEFVRHLNTRAAGPPLIHGVNISLSIPHEVRTYGCGATPVCVACDDLVQSGVVVVAAAGNRGWNERELGFGNFVFCSITDPGNAQRVITVGATHRAKPHTYGVSYFSSRGPTGDGRAKPDLVAPGEKIRGPIRGGAEDELDGTSMAAPFVSGAAAMVMARNRELMRNPQRIKEVLCASATDLGREKYFQGHGLVDVLRALQSI